MLFVTGLDRRRFSPHDSPHLCRLLDDCPSVSIRTIPSNELPSTIYTGTYPREHGMWQMTLKRDVPDTPIDRLLDGLPDIVTTTWQCLRHALDPTYDLPGVPRRRRRQFDVHRFKYTGRFSEEQPIIGGVPSIFSVLSGRSSYHFTKDFESLGREIAKLPHHGVRLSLLEVYAYDLFSHWNLDRPAAMKSKLTELDRQIGELDERCREQGVRFMLLSDHGQEPVRDSIDLRRALATAGVPRSDYTYYLEAAIARFWFRNDRARTRITALLESTENTTLLTYRQLHEHHICFDDDSYGEMFLYAHPGHVFHPNDFTQPLGNLYMALSESTMRHRLFNSRHRGYHGYLPGHPADEGFMILSDPECRAVGEQIALVDIAPTILALIDEPVPTHMKGTAAFQSKKAMGSSAEHVH
jgi:arylsulfatase A-like enzyme